MPLISATELFTGKTVQALCWTLVHSLWLGLLLATFAGIIILCTRNSRAAVRYNLLTASFLIFAVCIIITLGMQLAKALEKTQSTTAIAGATITENNIQAITGVLNENNATITNNVVAFFNEYALILVLAWFSIIVFRLVGLISGLYDLQKIKNRQLSDPGEYWNRRLQLLAARLGIRERIGLFQSGIAKIPMVLGHFKPIILFPVALLSTLPQEEVEAILVHELAHIRRKDYLVNLFQHLMEIIFFFNPAVLWVSALIKTERENCCDDIAVAQTGNKRNYINALLSFQEYDMANPRFVAGFTNKKYYLLQRIKRIIYNNNKTLNAMEKTFLASGLVLAGLLVVAFSYNGPQYPGKSNIAAQSISQTATDKTGGLSAQIKDTVPVSPYRILKEKGMTNLNTIVDGKRYDLKLKNDEVTDLSVDGEKIPDGKIAEYKTITDGIIKQACENIVREKVLSEKAMQLTELSKADAERSIILEKKLQELAMVNNHHSLILAQKDKELALLLPELKAQESLSLLKELAIAKDQQSLILAQKEKKLTLVLPELKSSESLMKELAMVKDQQSLILAQKEKELIRLLTLTAVKQNIELENLQSLQSKFDLDKEQALLSKLNAETSKQVNEQLKEAKESLVKAKEMEKISQTTSAEIINDLIREKIIKNKKDLSFTLNNDELIVNGVKQPHAIHQKLKEKYIKDPDWNFNYNNKQ